MDERAALRFLRRDFAEDMIDKCQRHLDDCDNCRAWIVELVRHRITDEIFETPTKSESVGSLVGGRYLVGRVLGAGAMGVVVAARDLRLDRAVALKLLHSVEERDDTWPDRVARLWREARTLARLSHPNTISIYDIGEEHNELYLVIELVEGTTLKRWLTTARRSLRERISVLLEAGQGLSAAHAAGLVHRDVKPDNVLVGSDGHARVADFGLACLYDETYRSSPEAFPAPSADLTRTGRILGTPAYMAPEQLRGEATQKSDQFAFSILAWETLFGQRPFSRVPTCSSERWQIVEPSKSQRVPRSVRRALERGLAPDPDHRFPSLHELLGKLRPYKRRTRLRGLAVLGFACALLALGGGGHRLYVDGRKADDANACSTRDGLAAVWNLETRFEVEAALISDISSRRRVETTLDRVAEQWRSVDRELCESRVLGRITDQTEELRAGCLQDRREELRTLLKNFAHAEGTSLEGSILGVLTITPATECDSTSTDTNRFADDAHGILRAKLARAEALLRSGRADKARKLLAECLEEARQRGVRSVETIALLDLAKANKDPNDVRELRQALVRTNQALVLAQSLADNFELARGWILLAHLLDQQDQPNFAEQQRALEMSRAALSAAGGDPDLEVAWEVTTGETLYRQARTQEAIQHLRTAVAKARQHPEHKLVLASALHDLVLPLVQIDQSAEAKRVADEALAKAEELTVPSSSTLIPLVAAVAAADSALGDYDASVANESRVIALARAARPPQQATIALHQIQLADSLAEAGKDAEAQVAIATGIEYFELAEPSSSMLGYAYVIVGELRERANVPEQALESYGRARKIFTDPDDVSIALTGIGRAELALGKIAASVKTLELALTTGDDDRRPLFVARTRFGLARALWASGDRYRSRADALTELARKEFLSSRAGERDAKELDTWLRDHRSRSRNKHPARSNN